MKQRINPRLLTHLIFTAFLAICYVAVGVFVIVLRSKIEGFPPALLITFGIACMLNGAFRLYRSYQNFQESKYEKD
jgi:prepilin signal peptidase PulO-like enzyme (type II secretory pathway)